MCGRFALALQADDVEQLDDAGYPALRVDQWVHRDRYVPRYNVAPRTHAPVIRRAQPEDPALVMHSMRWGLVPHWSKGEPPTLHTINARAENLEEGGGMWAGIKGRKRCVVVAQGYYEWLKKGTQRIPHFTRHKDRRLMLFAGLYDSATLDGQSEPLWTFTIVTTAASSSSAWLHDRQPVILTSQEALERWLDTSTQTWDPKLNRLFEPYHDSDAPLECYAVPLEVGKVGVESPTFIEPVQNRKDGIEAMFMRQTKAAANSSKRKRDPSPTEKTDMDGLVPTTATASPSPAKKRANKVESDMAEPELIVDVNAGTGEDSAQGSHSDVEILSGPLQSVLKAAEPKTKKEEQGDIVSPSSSQQRQSQPSSQPTSSPSRKPPNPVTGASSPRKKQEKQKPGTSSTTPKITSFFAKTAG